MVVGHAGSCSCLDMMVLLFSEQAMAFVLAEKSGAERTRQGLL